MKINLAIIALALAIPTASIAQVDSILINQNVTSNTFSSYSENISPFTKESKRFNDWSISAGVGVPLVQSSDLTSIKNGNGAGKDLFGYSAYLSVDKAITHAFGVILQYDRGETRQGWFNTKKENAPTTGSAYQQVGARTQFDAISILGDINFSNLLRRVDNKSPYRWALHGYAGVGTLAYRAYLEDASGINLQTEVKPFNLNSLFGQAGAGVKYKYNNKIDFQARLMYVVTGQDEFDGGGAQYSTINKREDQISDNFFNFSVGASLKLGKHLSHLMWHDPMQEIYYKLDVLADTNPDVEVCKNGDADNDGVCDDWDRQLDSPAGARVDGAGVALDTDLDGVIDLNDECVTVPGSPENNGCPTGNVVSSGGNDPIEQEMTLGGIEFELNSDKILPSDTPILKNAINYINSTSNGYYKVVGATDTRSSEEYNQKLSERRANSVRNYLIQNGVQSNKLEAEGRGEKFLKYPECEPATKCPEWKNKANRRVIFEAK